MRVYGCEPAGHKSMRMHVGHVFVKAVVISMDSRSGHLYSLFSGTVQQLASKERHRERSGPDNRA